MFPVYYLLLRIDLTANQVESYTDSLSSEIEDDFPDLFLLLIDFILLVLNLDLLDSLLSCVPISIEIPILYLLVFIVEFDLLINQKVVSILVVLNGASTEDLKSSYESIMESQRVKKDLSLKAKVMVDLFLLWPLVVIDQLV